MDFKEELMKLRDRLTGKKQEETTPNKKTTVLKTELTEEDIRLLSRIRTFREGEVSPAAAALANHFQSLIEPDLDNKVDKFIDWVINVRLKNEQSDGYKYHEPKRIRNFIEKMAVWYELRYPEPEIDKIFQPNKENQVDINEEIFKIMKELKIQEPS